MATAGKLLHRAYAMAQSLGAVPLTAEIRTIASRAGCPWTPRRIPHRCPGSGRRRPPDRRWTSWRRSPRGSGGARRGGRGLTNREIGQRLFISERTIGVHVSHIFDKLQVRTRVQASAIFLRNGAE
ncbi:LuxR C-terminal-related transcriptional regulator [Micromonospora sp. BRA006-A]|nr:LuxR C-terminal-related transcriptional regulator [Micromonospora sp. BRA006-A]